MYLLIQLACLPVIINYHDCKHLVETEHELHKRWRQPNPHYFCSLKRISELISSNLWIIALTWAGGVFHSYESSKSLQNCQKLPSIQKSLIIRVLCASHACFEKIIIWLLSHSGFQSTACVHMGMASGGTCTTQRLDSCRLALSDAWKAAACRETWPVSVHAQAFLDLGSYFRTSILKLSRGGCKKNILLSDV